MKLTKTVVAMGWYNLSYEAYLRILEMALERFPTASRTTHNNDNGTYDFILEG